MAKAGRPTEYNSKILKSAKAYLDSCKDEEKQEVIGLSAKGTELYKNRLKVNLPSIEGLALYLRVHKDTLYEWEKIHSEFSDVLGDIRAKQADRLINNGLSGDYNPTIAKLLLTKHGYSDKSETDITSKGEKLEPTMIQIIKPDAVENPSIPSESEAIPSVGTSDGQSND